jgi:hypothetical protein
MKKLTGLEQVFYTEKWNKVNNLNTEINTQFMSFQTDITHISLVWVANKLHKVKRALSKQKLGKHSYNSVKSF